MTASLATNAGPKPAIVVGQQAAVVAAVVIVGQRELADMVQTDHGLGLLAGGGEARQKNADQQSEDGDHDEQFDQRETASARRPSARHPWGWLPGGLHDSAPAAWWPATWPCGWCILAGQGVGAKPLTTLMLTN